MSIIEANRENLRGQRKFIILAVEDYIQTAIDRLSVQDTPKPVRILSSLRSTEIRMPRNIISDEFMDMILKANETKEYCIEFCQNKLNYIRVIVRNQPLIGRGQVIICYFFRELLQYIQKQQKERSIKNQPTQLKVVANG